MIGTTLGRDLRDVGSGELYILRLVELVGFLHALSVVFALMPHSMLSSFAQRLDDICEVQLLVHAFRPIAANLKYSLRNTLGWPVRHLDYKDHRHYQVPERNCST